MISDMTLTLHAARVNKNLTRKQVVDATGIAYAMLGKYERGEVEPRASDLQKLCRVYDVGIENLRFEASDGSKKKGK